MDVGAVTPCTGSGVVSGVLEPPDAPVLSGTWHRETCPAGRAIEFNCRRPLDRFYPRARLSSPHSCLKNRGPKPVRLIVPNSRPRTELRAPPGTPSTLIQAHRTPTSRHPNPRSGTGMGSNK